METIHLEKMKGKMTDSIKYCSKTNDGKVELGKNKVNGADERAEELEEALHMYHSAEELNLAKPHLYAWAHVAIDKWYASH